MLFGNMLTLNLFVGVVVDKFRKIKDLTNGYHLLSKEETEWVEL